MRIYVELPCGCRITPVSVVGMCFVHSEEYERKEREQDKRVAEMWANIERAPRKASALVSEDQKKGA